MPDFVFAYHGGTTPSSPEDVEKVMAEWMAWFDGMGDAVVIPGNPVGKSSTVYQDRVEDNGGANPISGYSLINVPSIDEAVALAKTCPILPDGTIEIAEAIDM